MLLLIACGIDRRRRRKAKNEISTMRMHFPRQFFNFFPPQREAPPGTGLRNLALLRLRPKFKGILSGIDAMKLCLLIYFAFTTLVNDIKYGLMLQNSTNKPSLHSIQWPFQLIFFQCPKLCSAPLPMGEESVHCVHSVQASVHRHTTNHSCA